MQLQHKFCFYLCIALKPEVDQPKQPSVLGLNQMPPMVNMFLNCYLRPFLGNSRHVAGRDRTLLMKFEQADRL